MPTSGFLSRTVVASLCGILLTSIGSACQIPVFRYALERWAPDPYEIVVLHQGELNEDAKALIETLQNQSSKSITGANLQVEVRTVDVVSDPELLVEWKAHPNKDQPLVVVRYPRNAQEVPDRVVGAFSLTQSMIDQLVDSPVRREVAKRLLDGDSAVWIFVPCGDPAQDKVALESLRQQVKQNEKDLKLPEPDELEAEDLLVKNSEIELRLTFGIVTLDRNDPNEQFLLKLLLASEPDLESLQQPMAFPVLGRGRVLYALVGKGIYAETVTMASAFIVGPCSCQVKEQNPGFDLLMAVDWDQKVGVQATTVPIPTAPKKPELIAIPPGRSR